MNGLQSTGQDVEHISFSYSSDEDFLITDLKTDKIRNGSSSEDVHHITTSDIDRKKTDKLSLAQRRRRLCSIAPRTPLATPTTSLTTPTSIIGHHDSSRQPISPGLSHTPDTHKVHSQSSIPSRPHKSPDSRWTGNQTQEEWSGDCSSDTSSDTWQPQAMARSNDQKEKKKKKKITSDNHTIMRKKKKIKEEPHSSLTTAINDESKELNKKSSDDEVLEGLKRKVLEDEMAEKKRLSEQNMTLDKELELSSSSSSSSSSLPSNSSDSDSEEAPIQTTVSSRISSGGNHGDHGNHGDGDVVVSNSKHRSKRQLLSSSSDSEEDEDIITKPKSLMNKKINNKPRDNTTNHKLISRQGVVQRSSEVKSVHREESQIKRPMKSSSPVAKKLRLVDIDFTGGRMRLPPPPHKTLTKHSPNKSRLHVSNRPGMGSGPDRKISGNASNVLKSKPKSLSRQHPSSSSERRSLPSQKDAVLAAKFPHKRKLLDTPPVLNRAHHMKSSKSSHRQ